MCVSRVGREAALKPQRKCKLLWTLVAILWVGSFLVALWVESPTPPPWWVAVFRGPVWSAFVAGVSLSTWHWYLVRDRGVLWRVAYGAGREDEAAEREPGKVVPMRRASP